MNGPFPSPQPPTVTARPMEFETLCPPPQLLPGESLRRYRTFQELIFRDLAPHSSIKWLLAIDIAELSWEMQRYRVLQHRVLTSYQREGTRRIDARGLGRCLRGNPDASGTYDPEPCLRSRAYARG